MVRDKLEIFLEKSQKVFNIEDLAVAWGYSDYIKTKNLVAYHLDKKIFRVAQDLYSVTDKLEILFNPLGVEKKNNYNLASRERAICDSLYISPSLAFDNLKKIDPGKILEISHVFRNKKLEKNVLRVVGNITKLT